MNYFKYTVAASLLLTTNAYSQGHRRSHTINSSPNNISLIKASTTLNKSPTVKIYKTQTKRIIESNGIPSHRVGDFPNSGNPHSIEEQSYKFEIPLSPVKNSRKTKLEMRQNFGVSLNGVPFDPGAAEWYRGNSSSPWQYEALSGAISLGLDSNHAHVQPNGAYHYHGIPDADQSGLIGWAADGFPIYSSITKEGIEIKSSYRLKKGSRPQGETGPGGKYDGTFTNDYEYIKDASELDECNGKNISDEYFPKGTYAYFLTKTFPVIPRCFMGNPDPSFTKNQDRAQRGTKRPRHPHGRRPPQEAIKACAGKTASSNCSFRAPHGTVRGQCRTMRDNITACVPSRR